MSVLLIQYLFFGFTSCRATAVATASSISHCIFIRDVIGKDLFPISLHQCPKAHHRDDPDDCDEIRGDPVFHFFNFLNLKIP